MLLLTYLLVTGAWFFVVGWYALLILLLSPWVLGPFRIWRRQRIRSDARLEPLAPVVPEDPPWALAFLDEQRAALGALGFVEVGRYRRAVMAGSTSLIAAHEHAGLGQLAVAVATYTTRRARGSMVDFSTAFDDDTRRATGNSAQVPVFAPVPTSRITRFPGLTDLGLLLRLHRALVARDAAREQRRSFDGDPVPILADGMRRELAAQLRAGYLRDDGAGAYRPTVKGAILMTWKLLPPWRELIASRMRRRAAEIRQELGI